MGVFGIERNDAAAPGLQFDDVSIAVADLDAAIAFRTERFGLRPAGRETVAAQGMAVARLACGPVAVPAELAGGSGVERFLSERGPGLHHVALRVPESGAAPAAIALPPAEPCPRTGAGGRAAAYPHPRATGGKRVERIERGSEG